MMTTLLLSALVAVLHTTTAEQPTSGGGGVWVPKIGDSWQYNLDTPVNTDVDAHVFLLDFEIAQETIDELHAKGKYVSCYISVGTVESWREDAHAFASSAVGTVSDDEGSERWIDITNEVVKLVMEARVYKAASKGCDAVEPDNISVWDQEDSGFTISRNEQISYNKWVAELVKDNGMKVGMKAGLSLIQDTSDFYDFAVSMECFAWDECDVYMAPFLLKGKPVFNVEFSKNFDACLDPNAAAGMDTIIKNFELDAPMCSCVDSSRDFECEDVLGYTRTEPSMPSPTPSGPAQPTPTSPAPATPSSTSSPEPSTPSPTPSRPSRPTPTSPAPATPSSTSSTPTSTSSAFSPEPSTPSPTPSTPSRPPSPAPATPSSTSSSSSSSPEPSTPTPEPSSVAAPTPPTPPTSGQSWLPRVGDSWNYNLDIPVDTNVNVDVIFIDMDGAQNTIDELHDGGKFVSCYISVGTVESWRGDAGAFPSSAIGNSWDDWEGERFLDITDQSVRDIMEARVETAAGMSCDAIEPDNMSNWNQEGTGLTISREDQIAYNIWFAETVRGNGMLVGMKNAIELMDDISDYYDFALNESCHEWNECDAYNIPFLDKGKPVFNVEYDVDYAICDEANKQGLDTIFKNYNVEYPVCSCVDSSRDVDCSDVSR